MTDQQESYAVSADPLFLQFPPWAGRASAGFDVNFLGQVTDVSFNAGWADAERTADRDAWPPYPAISEEIFEWQMLLSAVRDARGTFTMFEMGAGYGRWLVSAACALRMRHPGMPSRLVGVEAEPQHFHWMEKHFRDNGIDPQEHHLVLGAVDDKDGEVLLVFGDDPSAWYGQYVVANAGDRIESRPNTGAQLVRSFTIDALLADVDRVDFMDFDIQGAEIRAIPSAIAAMTKKVKRVFVEIHGFETDAPVADAFSNNGWLQLHRYTAGNTLTPFGQVELQEGVQCWLNPALK